MSINILEAAESGDLISLGELARLLGKSKGTLIRWAVEGVRGAKLETAFSGAERVTTREAFQRFQDAQIGVASIDMPHDRMSASERRLMNRIDKQLAADGF